MTESELAAAIAYMENRNGLASKDNYLHFDRAVAVVLEAAQNILDIAQDPDTRNVPIKPIDVMTHAGMDMYDYSFGDGPYIGSVETYHAMVMACPRDSRLPQPDPKIL